ncbi:hypothetical protein AM1_G0167 (plasmid) [Acaryochloris marina MBIC11017]|uniref:Uncharacterized protein n=1 Tax=Acaryochloris marina (strain MBIC 11017) TaxID=329726 RepID=A8ZQR1_ACAM1|nr:hypothetical protein AM1_G0167 [Acaryochloris marina MBIC11017]
MICSNVDMIRKFSHSIFIALKTIEEKNLSIGIPFMTVHSMNRNTYSYLKLSRNKVEI